MSKYFILGQIAALNYYMATTKAKRHDVRCTYIKIMAYIVSELDRLNKMLVDNETKYNSWKEDRVCM